MNKRQRKKQARKLIPYASSKLSELIEAARKLRHGMQTPTSEQAFTAFRDCIRRANAGE